MRLGIVSDTHGEVDNLLKAARDLAGRWQADMLVHLGDEWEDMEGLCGLEFADTVRVPGVYCPQYRDPSISNRIISEIGGFRFLFPHPDRPHANDLPDDPDPQQLASQGKVDIVCYGHTHIPELRREGDVVWLNPGHLKNQDKKGYPPSFAAVSVTEGATEIRLINLQSGKVFQKLDYQK